MKSNFRVVLPRAHVGLKAKTCLKSRDGVSRVCFQGVASLLERFEALGLSVGCEGPVAVGVGVTAAGLRARLPSDESVNGHDGDGEHRNGAQQHTDRKHPVRIRLHLRLREVFLQGDRHQRNMSLDFHFSKCVLRSF